MNKHHIPTMKHFKKRAKKYKIAYIISHKTSEKNNMTGLQVKAEKRWVRATFAASEWGDPKSEAGSYQVFIHVEAACLGCSV